GELSGREDIDEVEETKVDSVGDSEGATGGEESVSDSIEDGLDSEDSGSEEAITTVKKEDSGDRDEQGLLLPKGNMQVNSSNFESFPRNSCCVGVDSDGTPSLVKERRDFVDGSKGDVNRRRGNLINSPMRDAELFLERGGDIPSATNPEGSGAACKVLDKLPNPCSKALSKGPIDPGVPQV
ncbi:hypothetical protein U1Q18_014462, partial [Sarracenia purpurea var. burkii]